MASEIRKRKNVENVSTTSPTSATKPFSQKSASQLIRDAQQKSADWKWEERQFVKPEKDKTIPYQSIAFSVVLMLFGLALLVLPFYFQDINDSIVITIVGLMVFTPGFFYSRIAFMAWRRVPGYSYDDIPE